MLGVSKMIGRWCSTWHYWDNCPLMIWLEETVDSLSLSNTDRWNVLDVDCCCTTSASQVNGPLLFFSNTSRGWWQVWWWSFGQQWGLIQNGRKWWKRRTRRIRKSIIAHLQLDTNQISCYCLYIKVFQCYKYFSMSGTNCLSDFQLSKENTSLLMRSLRKNKNVYIEN